MLDFDFNTMTTVLNYLFIAAIAWIKSIEIKLKNIPLQTSDLIKESHNVLINRIERLETRIDRLLETNKTNNN